MNGFEEIQESIKFFYYEKIEVQKQILEIEQKRTKLAQKRNEEKKNNSNSIEINELGKQISELGIQSQELQNKLDFKLREIKVQIDLIIDNSVAEGIRKIRKINEEVQELEDKISNQKERDAKYELQKQEFYARFGRMPELSQNAIEEHKIQEEICEKSLVEIDNLNSQIESIKNQITELAKTKREVRNGNWRNLLVNTEKDEEISIETITIEEMEPIEEIYIEEFGEVEELIVEPFELIEEITVKDMGPIEELNIREFEMENDCEKNVVENVEIKEETPIETVDEIEELAKAIIEEIVAEQTQPINNYYSEESVAENLIQENEVDDIIVFEVEAEKEEKIRIPLFGAKATISNIIIKIQDNQLVYKAQMSDENEIKICPAKMGTENVLLRDKQNREECKEILINYAINENKIFDKKVISKIDPLVCELLIECAEKYSFDAQELIYNYAMSFSKAVEIDVEKIPDITYNLSFIDTSELNKKEKAIIKRICKNTRTNNSIDIIETFTGFRKFKYALKRLFAINNVNVLPESKY